MKFRENDFRLHGSQEREPAQPNIIRISEDILKSQLNPEELEKYKQRNETLRQAMDAAGNDVLQEAAKNFLFDAYKLFIRQQLVRSGTANKDILQADIQARRPFKFPVSFDQDLFNEAFGKVQSSLERKPPLRQ